MASNPGYCKICGYSKESHENEDNAAAPHDFNPIVLTIDHDNYLKKAQLCVLATEPLDDNERNIKLDQLYVVWFAKTLQNWKALISTDAAPGRYWEVTYNGAFNESYVDTYKKEFNTKVTDSYFNRVPDEPVYNYP